MALSFCASALLLAAGVSGQGPSSVLTAFRPSIDLPVVQNTAGQYQAIYGMCNGIDELSNVYYRYRIANKAPGLNDVTDLINKSQSGGAPYLKKLLETATYKSLGQGQPNVKLSEGVKDPQGFAQSVVDRIAANNMPVSIGLGGPVNHRVTVYGADKVNGQWVLRIADPNVVGAAGDNVRLVYDSSLKTWRSEVNGRPSTVWTGAGVVRSAIDEPNKYIDLMQMGLQGTKITEIREKLNVSLVPTPTDCPKKKVVLSKDAKVGGVQIQFDPGLFTSGIDEAQLAAMEKRARQFLESDEKGVLILEPEARTLEVALVPLASISPKGDLGGLTRVSGFVVRRDGSLVIVGRREPGQSPIPAEILAVALQSVYERGSNPYVSLDPPAGVVVGPQRVRIGGIAANLRNTKFVKMLLDADYEMKKVNLGKLSPPVEGFRRWVDLMNEASTPGFVRMWLSPLAAPIADSYIYRRNAEIAVLFESQVRVLSAQEKMEEEGVNRMAVDEVAERAASQFTLRYDEIAKTCPDLSRLRGVFDVAKLCAALRGLKIKSAQLAPWLAYVPPNTPIPESYPAIGPEWTPDGKYMITGGAIADARFGPEGAVETASLEPLFEGGATASIRLPSTMKVSDAMQAAFQARSQMSQALRSLRDGNPETTLEAAERMLEISPEDERAGILRGLALVAMGKMEQAVASLDPLAERYPAAKAIRAGARADLGDSKGAIADAKSAVVAAMDNESVLVLSVLALIEALALDDAETALRQLRMVSPNGSVNAMLADRLARMRSLGPEKARARQRLVKRVPLAVQISANNATPEGLERAVAVLRELEAGVYQVPAELNIPDVLRFSIVMRVSSNLEGVKPEVVRAAEAAVERLTSDHPDWAASHIAQAVLANAQFKPAEEVAAALRNAAEREPAGDPVLEEFKGTRPISRFTLALAAVLYIDPATPDDRREVFGKLVEELETEPIAKRFLSGLRSETNFRPFEFLKTAGMRGSYGDDETRYAMLDRLTSGCESLDPKSAIYSLPLALATVSLGIATHDFPSYNRLMDRSLAMAARSPQPQLLEGQIERLRGLTWLSAAKAILQSLFRPGSPLVRSMDDLSKRMDRLTKPASKRDSMASKRKILADAYTMLSALPDKVRPAILARLNEIRRAHGTATADRVAFCVAMMQEFTESSPPKSLDAVAKMHPGIEKTSEYVRLKKLYGTLSGILIQSKPDQIWPEVLKGIASRSDGMGVVEMLKTLQGARTQDNGRIARFSAQARAQAEFGGFPGPK